MGSQDATNGSFSTGIVFCQPGHYNIKLNMNFVGFGMNQPGANFGGTFGSTGGTHGYCTEHVYQQVASYEQLQNNFQFGGQGQAPSLDTRRAEVTFYPDGSGSGSYEECYVTPPNVGVPPNSPKSWCFSPKPDSSKTPGCFSSCGII